MKKLFLDDEYLWIGTEATGLYRMNLKTYEYERFGKNTGKSSLNSDVVLDVLRGKDGRIYIATDNGGLNIYDESTKQMLQYTYRASESTSLNSNALVCLWRDRTDNIWIGTFNGGLNIIKQENKGEQ